MKIRGGILMKWKEQGVKIYGKKRKKGKGGKEVNGIGTIPLLTTTRER